MLPRILLSVIFFVDVPDDPLPPPEPVDEGDGEVDAPGEGEAFPLPPVPESDAEGLGNSVVALTAGLSPDPQADRSTTAAASRMARAPKAAPSGLRSCHGCLLLP